MMSEIEMNSMVKIKPSLPDTDNEAEDLGNTMKPVSDPALLNPESNSNTEGKEIFSTNMESSDSPEDQECKGGSGLNLMSKVCELCPENTFSPEGDSTCISCPYLMTAPPGSDSVIKCVWGEKHCFLTRRVLQH